MEDYRVSWMKEQTFAALGLHNDKLFLELLSRDGKKASRELLSSLDSQREGYSQAMLFYALEHEVEDMVEVMEGNYPNKPMGVKGSNCCHHDFLTQNKKYSTWLSKQSNWRKCNKKPRLKTVNLSPVVASVLMKRVRKKVSCPGGYSCWPICLSVQVGGK